MKEKLKNAKAITLIALIITIIVLMILVMTTVQTVIGEKGIIGIARDSREKSELATEEEQLRTAYLSAATRKDVENIQLSDLQLEVNNSQLDILSEPYGNLLKVTFNKTGNSYTLSTSGEIKKVGKINHQVNEIFGAQYELATEKLQTLTLEQKIKQMLLVTYIDDSKIKTSAYGGILFFEVDFQGKTEAQIQEMIEGLENTTNIPPLTAVDEEGKTYDENGEGKGKGVIRVSSNTNLTNNHPYLQGAPFPNSKTLYTNGGFDLINEDTREKSKFLFNLGLNLNLAPVVDICQEGDYMYHRSIGLDVKGTSTYAQVVMEASKEAKKEGYEVSYCLKHFPGYGSNADTHQGFSVDTRTLEEVKQDMTSFEKGIQYGAESVLVSHNIVSSVDAENPASLSPKINSLLRNDLNFTGIIITDALAMKALDNIEGSKYVKAVLAGNDILTVTNGEEAYNDIWNAIQEGTISEEIIDRAVTRILAWKYYKNIL